MSVNKSGRTIQATRKVTAKTILLRWETMLVFLFLAVNAMNIAISPNYLNAYNLFTNVNSFLVKGMVALPMAYILLLGEIDLSVGSTVCLAATILGIVYNATGSAVLGILAALAVGLACGVINGVILTQFPELAPMIVTLATMTLFRGISMKILGDTSTSGMRDVAWFGQLYEARLGVVPYLFLLFCLLAVVFGLVMNVIGAYCIFRQNKLRTFMTLFFVFSLMFNGGTVPTYMVIRTLGMTGTIWSLILPGCTNAMFIMMTMNAYKQVPYSTIESAELDGAGHFTIMFKILLPQAMGLVTVCMINTAILSWNSWFEASIYVPSNKEIWPLQLWIRQIVADNESILQAATPDWNKYLVSYCVIIIATLPVLIAMPFAQKQLQKGSLLGAVKE